MEIRFAATDITADEITQLSIELNALNATIEEKQNAGLSFPF